MTLDKRSDEEIQRAAKQMFEGIAPERHDELIQLWHDYNPKFHLLSDIGPDGPFVIDAGAFRDIRFNHRALRAVWLASFIAWEGYLQIHRLATAGSADFGRFNNMLQVFERVLAESDPTHVALPKGVPEPGHYLNAKVNPQERSVAELATFAIGWIFLHEIRHIKHQQEDTGARPHDTKSKFHGEELSCDAFATIFILENVENYSKIAVEDKDRIRCKRELGIYFAFFAMTLICADSWGSSNTHPAMQERIDATIKLMGSSGTRMSDAVAHAAFAALWQKFPNAPGPFRASTL